LPSATAARFTEGNVIGGAHLDEETLVGLTQGFLTHDEESAADLHLGDCAECQRLLSAWRSAQAAPAEQPLAPGRSLGRFVLLQEVGRGSVGRVMAAWDPVLNRKVALKVLRREVLPTGEKAYALLMREAQALARLTHPNVVAVHDAGTDGAVTWLAMEFVEGTTLSQWLAQGPRSVAEVVAQFRAAGQALAQAHRVGLLHRDFKPSNVLVGSDGRLRVTDFGLAALAREVEGAPHAPLPFALDTSLTETGAMVGTPAYLAPESWEGAPASAASDQFSFSVALFEAVTGARPFTGETVVERLASVREGPRWPERSAKLSRRLRAAIDRGLKFDPKERFDSMDAFGRELALLERRRSFRTLGLGLATLLGLAGLLGGVLWERNRSRCADLWQQLTHVWDAPMRARLAEDCATLEKPQLCASLSSVLDGWTARWLEARESTCRQEARTGTPQRAQISCLEEQRRLLAALLADLHGADLATLRKAPEALGSLPSPSICSSELKAARESNPALSEPLMAARSALVLGNLASAESKAQKILEQFARASAPRAEAEAVGLLAEVQFQRGNFPQAEAGFREAILKGERANADKVCAVAWTRLAHVVGVSLRRHDEGLMLVEMAEAVAEGRGDAGDRAELALTRGDILRKKGALSQALARAAVAKTALAAAYGEADWRVGKAENLQGMVLLDLNHPAEAEHAFEQAEAHCLHLLGASHPLALGARDNRGIALRNQRKFEQAEQVAREVLDLRLQTTPEHPSVAASYVNLGRVLHDRGKLEEALAAYREALRRKEAAFGPEHVEVAMALNNLAGVLAEQHRAQDGLQLHERALAIRLRALGPDHLDVAMSLVNLGHSNQELRQFRPAIDRYQRALAIEEKALGKDDPTLAEELTGIGECSLELHQPAAAVAVLERAVALREAHPEDPQDLAQSRFALARALQLTRGNAARVSQLAAQAEAEAAPEVAQAVKAWRAGTQRK
jgi:tetratricopeptide (TPR) repeat protein